ncbi:MAG: ankyrin repeat domain-containing protein [Flavobacterium sp.]|nr:ankyrin repeat domain-containing protein [Flavobacterium sp.]
MKKSVICLSLAILAFSTSSFAANVKEESTSIKIAMYAKNTPLCIAIQKGEIDLVKKLIEYGADVNEKSFGMTPLMVAARYNKVEIIKILLEKGAKQNEKNEKGFTALKYAQLSYAKEAESFLKSV